MFAVTVGAGFRALPLAQVLGDTELYADACIAAGQAYRQLGTPEVAIGVPMPATCVGDSTTSLVLF